MQTKSEKIRQKNEYKNLIIQTKNREKKSKEHVDIRWIVRIILIAFIISIIFTSISEIALPKVNLIVGIIIVIFFILVGIVFDMIGVSVTSADLTPFNSMSSRKVDGAKLAVILIKNADKVSSFCCDVIGDICGIISGSASATIALSLSKSFNINSFFITIIVTAIVASLTIGGKAIGKSFAINKNNIIIFKFAKFINHFYNKSR